MRKARHWCWAWAWRDPQTRVKRSRLGRGPPPGTAVGIGEETRDGGCILAGVPVPGVIAGGPKGPRMPLVGAASHRSRRDRPIGKVRRMRRSLPWRARTNCPPLVPVVKQPKAKNPTNEGRQEPMLTAMPMVMMTKAVVRGRLGVMRCLRNLMRTLVVDCLCLLCLGYLARTRRCLRKLMGMRVVDCLRLLYLDYFVLARSRL